jgi:hypothetical protein
MVRVLGLSVGSVGVIEGMAEAANSLIKIISGAASDWIGRRKPLVVSFARTRCSRHDGELKTNLFELTCRPRAAPRRLPG